MTTLKLGASGPDVTTLQNDLSQLGYSIQIDGSFGNETLKVVIQFQHDHNLSADGVVGPNTWATLNDLINISPVVGVDVSHHNGIINWNAVNPKQIRFAICKGSQGMSFKDDLIDTNMSELSRLNYIRGVYHFFTFVGVTAKQQVDNFLKLNLNFSQKGMLPPVVDVEWQISPSLNNYIIQNRAECAQKLLDWLTAIEKATGKRPIIYTAASFWRDLMGDPAGFEQYPLWIASYRSGSPTLAGNWSTYTFWQFTSQGQVSGIAGQVDKNYFNGTLQQLKKLANS
jgi:lysozyme